MLGTSIASACYIGMGVFRSGQRFHLLEHLYHVGAHVIFPRLMVEDMRPLLLMLAKVSCLLNQRW